MGQPSSLKPYGGLSAGGYFEDEASDFTAYLSAGIRKDLLSPVAAVAALQLEGYGGVRGGEIDGGVRGLFTIPFIWLGFGVDWSFRDGSVPFLLRLSIPFQRGGFVTQPASTNSRSERHQLRFESRTWRETWTPSDG